MTKNNSDGVFSEIERVKEIISGNIRSVFVYTFGCQQNEADSERIMGMAEKMGYSPAKCAEDADLIIVNTCAVRAHAEDKALSLIGGFKALKRMRPELIVGIVGCMAAEEHLANRLKTDFHYVDFTLEPSLIHKIPEMVRRALLKEGRCFLYNSGNTEICDGLPLERASKYRALVSVMYGCNNFCSYCIVPYTRGRERSRDSEEILKECREAVNNGAKEIMLLGQNVNSYKSDIDFAELISRVAEIEGDFIIRFMTSHPKDASARLIDAIGKYTPKISPFFHLPLQSGSDRILSLMNRRYTLDSYLKTVRKIKEKIPNIALSTDIIVGFPSETEEDFEATLSALREVEYDLVYAFIYSPRVGTRAACFTDSLSKKEKSERLSRLLTLQDEISLRKNASYVDRVERVLVDSAELREGKRILTGKTGSMKTVHFESKDGMIGEFINVKIKRSFVSHLEGEEERG